MSHTEQPETFINHWKQICLDSSKQTSPTSGCCPSCPLNWPTKVFQSRWTREKIWSWPCSSKRTPTLQSADGTPQHLPTHPRRSTSSSDTTTGKTPRPELVTKDCSKVSAQFKSKKKKTIKCTTGRGSYSGFEICRRCTLGEFDREHQGHYISSGHETAAGGKSGVLFLGCWCTQRWYIGTVWIQTAKLVTSGSVDIPLFSV